MPVLDDPTRDTLMLISLGLIFLIIGGYFGIIEKRVGLAQFVPVEGDAAQIWGAIMCVVGALLIFIGLS